LLKESCIKIQYYIFFNYKNEENWKGKYTERINFLSYELENI